jgi:hypothetical protein
MSFTARIFNRSLVAIAIASCILSGIGCGGGGGSDSGSNSARYAGTWDYKTIKLSDSCNLRANAQLNATMTVQQNGSSVSVQAGSLSLTGVTNDKDGFNANLIQPGTNGCTQGFGISLQDASDGEGLIAVAIAVQCGNRTCSVGYGGTAVRSSTRSNTKSLDADATENTVAQINDLVANSAVGFDGGLENAVEETLLEIDTTE